MQGGHSAWKIFTKLIVGDKLSFNLSTNIQNLNIDELQISRQN